MSRMSRPLFKAVLAMSSNRVIGRDGTLPWSLPEDLRWFKKLTLGHPIIMGRKTMDSIGRALPGRRNIVLSSSGAPLLPGFELARSPEELAPLLAGEKEAAVIGGAQIFSELLPLCDEIFLSYVFEAHEGDVYLPEFEDDFTRVGTLFANEAFELRHYRRNPVAE